MTTIIVVCIVIVFVVLLLAVITTSKAYSYKHTVDSLDNNPYLNQENETKENEPLNENTSIGKAVRTKTEA